MRISGRMALAPAIAGLLFLALAPAAQPTPPRAVSRRRRPGRAELRPRPSGRIRPRAAPRADAAATIPPPSRRRSTSWSARPRCRRWNPDRRVAAAARQHTQTQGARGDVGHGAAGALGQRLRGQGVWAGLSAENISYGLDDPATSSAN
jgi:hypothetical protein